MRTPLAILEFIRYNKFAVKYICPCAQDTLCDSNEKKEEWPMHDDLSVSRYQFGKYFLLEPPIRVHHEAKILNSFRKSADAGEPRGMFMLGKLLVLWSSNSDQAGIGLRWVERAAEAGYIIAGDFLRFYCTYPAPINRELLERVTLELEDPDLLCLAGQLKLYDSPFIVFMRDEHPMSLEGIKFLEKAAQLGNLEAIRFLYEAYMGYFWQIFPNAELARTWLEKYLAITNDPLEQKVLNRFGDYCKHVGDTRRHLFYETRVRYTSRNLPTGRGSLDSSFYDKFRN